MAMNRLWILTSVVFLASSLPCAAQPKQTTGREIPGCDGPGSCCGSPVLSPSGVSAVKNGGTFIFNVTSCAWTASTEAPWLTLVSSGSDTGVGTVSVQVAPNPIARRRVAQIRIASEGGDVLLTIEQTGGCAVTLSSSGDFAVPANGRKSTFQSAATCTWSAASISTREEASSGSVPAPWAQVYPLTGTGTQKIEYNVFPNFSTNPRTAAIYVGDAKFDVSQDAGTGTSNERFVRLAYFNFLGRLPTQAEITLQTGTLQAGTTRAQLIRNLFNSEEFNQGGRFIAGLYVGLLDRDAEYDGWLFQRAALASGTINQTQLVVNFLNSAEFKLKFPSPNGSQFVTQLYRYILLREPTLAEVTFHVSTSLTPDTGTARVELARRFLNTNEFRIGTGSRLTVFLLFSTLLQRDPSITERAFWTTPISRGDPLVGVINSFVESAEFAKVLE